MIDVPEEQIERLYALLYAPVKLAPIPCGNHARNHIEGQNAVDCGPVAINCERDSESEKFALGVFGASAKLTQFNLLKTVPKRREIVVAMFRRSNQLAIEMSRVVIIERRHGCGILQSCDCRHATPSSASAALTGLDDDEKTHGNAKKRLAQQTAVPEPKFRLISCAGCTVLCTNLRHVWRKVSAQCSRKNQFFLHALHEGF